MNRKRLDDVIGERTSLLKTAIAEDIAFTIRALAADPPPQNWYDAAAKLGTWAVENVDILRNIPETIRNERIKRQTNNSKPSRSATFCLRSAIALESGYQAKRIGSEEEKEENDQIRPSNLQAKNARCQPQGLREKDKLEDSANGEVTYLLLGHSMVPKSLTWVYPGRME